MFLMHDKPEREQTGKKLSNVFVQTWSTVLTTLLKSFTQSRQIANSES